MTILHKPEPKTFVPFLPSDFELIQRHVQEVRKVFDWPGIPYHDANESDPARKFNRWCWHNLPLLRFFHNKPEFIAQVSEMVGMSVKPSYCFLSMYGPEGVCPLHSDRPQCQFTVDLLVDREGGDWPIYVEEKPYLLQNRGEALLYSGTGQPHYRKPAKEDGGAISYDLAFFHFVPIEWQGELS